MMMVMVVMMLMLMDERADTWRLSKVKYNETSRYEARRHWVYITESRTPIGAWGRIGY